MKRKSKDFFDFQFSLSYPQRMKKYFLRALIYFSAGSLGGLANSLMVYAFGVYGLSSSLGVSISPQLTPAWLYPRIVWGGIWGMLFFLVGNKSHRVLIKALLVSLGPTLIQLLVIFPLKAHKGYLGVELGALTPVLVVFFNFVWGFVALMTIKSVKS